MSDERIEANNRAVQELSIDAFMNKFNLVEGNQPNGTPFKTDITKTHGQLTLRNGKLTNVNRYDPLGIHRNAETKGNESHENYQVRKALMNAIIADLTNNKYDDAAIKRFLKMAEETLGMTQDMSTSQKAKPLSRRTVKQLLVNFSEFKKLSEKEIADAISEATPPTIVVDSAGEHKLKTAFDFSKHTNEVAENLLEKNLSFNLGVYEAYLDKINIEAKNFGSDLNSLRLLSDDKKIDFVNALVKYTNISLDFKNDLSKQVYRSLCAYVQKELGVTASLPSETVPREISETDKVANNDDILAENGPVADEPLQDEGMAKVLTRNLDDLLAKSLKDESLNGDIEKRTQACQRAGDIRSDETINIESYAYFGIKKWCDCIKDKNVLEAFLSQIQDQQHPVEDLKKALDVMLTGITENVFILESCKGAIQTNITANENVKAKALTKCLAGQLKAIADAQKLDSYSCVNNSELKFATSPFGNGNNGPTGVPSGTKLVKTPQFRQAKNGNTCPLISTMNAMAMVDDNTRRMLLGAMTKRTDSSRNGEYYYEFPAKPWDANEKIKISSTEIIAATKKYPKIPFSGFSEFEKAAFLAMNKYADISGFEHINPGESTDLFMPFQLFGLESDSAVYIPKAATVSEAEMLRIAHQAINALRDGNVCIVRLNGHFMALSGVTFDPSGVKLVVSESLGDHEKPTCSLGVKELLSNAEACKREKRKDLGFQLFIGKRTMDPATVEDEKVDAASAGEEKKPTLEPASKPRTDVKVSPLDPVATKTAIDAAMGKLDELFKKYNGLDQVNSLVNEDEQARFGEKGNNHFGIPLESGDVYDKSLQSEIDTTNPTSTAELNFRFALTTACQDILNLITARIDAAKIKSAETDEFSKDLGLRNNGEILSDDTKQVETFGKYLDEHVISKSSTYTINKGKLINLFKALPASVTDVLSDENVSDRIDQTNDDDKHMRHLAGVVITDMVVHLGKALGIVHETWDYPEYNSSKYENMVKATAKKCWVEGFSLWEDGTRVCEVGCAFWLAAMQSKLGITKAQTLSQNDCLPLQLSLEAKNASVHGDDEALKEHAHARRAAREAINLLGTHDATATFRGLAPGKMAFLAASDKYTHHAMAVYAESEDELYLFNPGVGVWKGAANQIALILQQQINNGLGCHMSKEKISIVAQFLEPADQT